MSKAMDLLKKIVEANMVEYMELMILAEELLAQPEQTEQVPEPLSDEDICEILLKKEWKGFVDLVRIIEKAHGITGGGE